MYARACAPCIFPPVWAFPDMFRFHMPEVFSERFSYLCSFHWKFSSIANRKRFFPGTWKADFSAPGLKHTQLTPLLVKAQAIAPLPCGQVHPQLLPNLEQKRNNKLFPHHEPRKFLTAGQRSGAWLSYILLTPGTSFYPPESIACYKQTPSNSGSPVRASPRASAQHLPQSSAHTKTWHSTAAGQGAQRGTEAWAFPGRGTRAGLPAPRHVGFGEGMEEKHLLHSSLAFNVVLLWGKGTHLPSHTLLLVPFLISSCSFKPDIAPCFPLCLFHLQLNRVTHDCFF